MQKAVIDPLVLGIEAPRHIGKARFLEGDGIGWHHAEQAGGFANDIAGRRRLVIADIIDRARSRPCNGGTKDVGDILDMDAAEDLSLAGDDPRPAGAQRIEGAPARPVDAGEPKDMQGQPSPLPERPPALLGREPATSPLRCRRGRCRLIDEGAAMIAIDPGRREIAEPGDIGSCRQRLPMRAQNGIALRIGRYREKDMARRCKGGLPRPIERAARSIGMKPCRLARILSGPAGIAGRPIDLPAFFMQKTGECTGTVTESEAEKSFPRACHLSPFFHHYAESHLMDHLRHIAPFLAFFLLLQALSSAAQESGHLPEITIETDRKSPGPESEDTAGQQGSPSESLAPYGLPFYMAPAGSDLAAEAEHYLSCIERASEEDSGPALAEAQSWLLAGGGLPARHCLALALFASHDYEGAAEALRDMAENLRAGRELNFDIAGSDGLRLLLAGIQSQLGNALLLAGQPEDAYTALSIGLADAPVSAVDLVTDLHVDRGRALALSGDVEGAIADLEKARRMAPGRADILYFLASGRRLLGDLEAAMAAISRAIEFDDKEPGYFLERGNIRFLDEDRLGARSDWLKVVSDWPESEAAEAARANLEHLYALMAGEDAPQDP